MRKEGKVEIDRREKAEGETCNDMQVVREWDRKPNLEMKTWTNQVYIYRIKLDKCSYITLFNQHNIM